MDHYLPICLGGGGILLFLSGVGRLKFSKLFIGIIRGSGGYGVPISEENARQRNLFSAIASLICGVLLLVAAIVVYLAHGTLG